jgi:hypothetical protein
VSVSPQRSTIASRTYARYTRGVTQALQSLKCCLNPKVLIGLAAAAGAVVLLAPSLVASAFPLLLALVCPLSMLVMMARMGTNKETATGSAPNTSTNTEAPVPGLAASPEARLALLRAQQQVLAEQNASIAAEIAALNSAETAANPPSRALRQAEQVAALADSHAPRERA